MFQDIVQILPDKLKCYRIAILISANLAVKDTATRNMCNGFEGDNFSPKGQFPSLDQVLDYQNIET